MTSRGGETLACTSARGADLPFGQVRICSEDLAHRVTVLYHAGDIAGRRPGYPSHKSYPSGCWDLPRCNASHPFRDPRRRAEAKPGRPLRATQTLGTLANLAATPSDVEPSRYWRAAVRAIDCSRNCSGVHPGPEHERALDPRVGTDIFVPGASFQLYRRPSPVYHIRGRGIAHPLQHPPRPAFPGSHGRPRRIRPLPRLSSCSTVDGAVHASVRPERPTAGSPLRQRHARAASTRRSESASIRANCSDRDAGTGHVARIEHVQRIGRHCACARPADQPAAWNSLRQRRASGSSSGPDPSDAPSVRPTRSSSGAGLLGQRWRVQRPVDLDRRPPRKRAALGYRAKAPACPKKDAQASFAPPPDGIRIRLVRHFSPTAREKPKTRTIPACRGARRSSSTTFKRLRVPGSQAVRSHLDRLALRYGTGRAQEQDLVGLLDAPPLATRVAHQQVGVANRFESTHPEPPQYCRPAGLRLISRAFVVVADRIARLIAVSVTATQYS